MRRIFLVALLSLLGTAASGCEVFRLLPQYGGIRGTIDSHDGEGVIFGSVDVSSPTGVRMGYFHPHVDDADFEDGSVAAPHDFGDGHGAVPARMVKLDYGIGGNAWFTAPGQAGPYYLRQGEFVIDHVTAGQRQLHVLATAVTRDDSNGDVETVLPVNVIPDQWTTVRIVLPAPTPTPRPSEEAAP